MAKLKYEPSYYPYAWRYSVTYRDKYDVKVVVLTKERAKVVKRRGRESGRFVLRMYR